MRNYWLMGTGFQLGNDRKVLGMDSGDVCTMLWMHFMPVNIPKNIKMVNFVMDILPQYKSISWTVCKFTK